MFSHLMKYWLCTNLHRCFVYKSWAGDAVVSWALSTHVLYFYIKLKHIDITEEFIMGRDHWKVSVLGSSSSLLTVWPSVCAWPQFHFLCQASSCCSDFACYLNFWKNKLWLMCPFTCSLQLTVVNSKNPSPMCRQAVHHHQSSNRKQHWWVWHEWRQGNGSVKLFYEECWCSIISFVCIQSLSPGPASASPRAPEHPIKATLALDYGHFLLPVLRLAIFLLDLNTFPPMLL